jgi:hypothetical protein
VKISLIGFKYNVKEIVMKLSKMLKLESNSIHKNNTIDSRNDCTDILISAKFNDHLHHILPQKPTCYQMAIDLILHLISDSDGLKYIIPRLCTEYVNKNGRSEESFKEIIEILEHLKKEFNDLEIDDVEIKEGKLLRLETLNNDFK